MDTQLKAVNCPKCGKKTKHITRYTDGSVLYIHSQKKNLKPFPHMLIVESCSDNNQWGM